MKRDIQNKKIIERDRRLREVPVFVYDFIETLDTDKEISTQIEYIKDIHSFLEFLLLDTLEGKYISIQDITIDDMGKVSERDIRNFLSYITEYKRQYKKKDGTIIFKKYSNNKTGQHRKLSTLHTLYRYFLIRKLIQIDPTANIEIKLPKTIGDFNRLEDSDLKLYLETILDKTKASKDAKHFHDILSERDYVMVLLLAYLGIRVSELVQIDISDVNLDKATIIVHRKRDKIQKLDIPDVIIDSLADYINNRKLIENIPYEYKDVLFLSLQKKRIDTRTVRYMLNKYKKRACINEKISPHTFRRTFGTKLYNTTSDIELTSRILGHDSIETSRKYYAKLDEKRTKTTIQNFNYDDNDIVVNNNISLDLNQLKKLSDKLGMSIDDLINTLK
jgi:integrase/recombinase XerC